MNSAVQTPQSIFFPLSSCKLLKTCCSLVFMFLFSLGLEWCLLLYFFSSHFLGLQRARSTTVKQKQDKLESFLLGWSGYFACTRKAKLDSLEQQESSKEQWEEVRVWNSFFKNSKENFYLPQLGQHKITKMSCLFCLFWTII